MLKRCFLTSIIGLRAGTARWKLHRTFLSPTVHAIKNSKTFSDDTTKTTQFSDKISDDLNIAIARKHHIFSDKDSPVIVDIEEERELRANGMPLHNVETNEFSGLDLKRGARGVYNIEELVEVLRRDKAIDIFVASLPSALKYVDYIVLVTGRSPRHMLAMAEFVRKLFKKKMHSTDIIPRIEGESSKDWIALDLGNIALHVFSKPARRMYDLDSLWGVGPEHDDLFNKPDDPLTTLLEQHSVYLGTLQPNETLG